MVDLCVCERERLTKKSLVYIYFSNFLRVVFIHLWGFFTFLLAYISCTEGFIVTFPYYNVLLLGSSPPSFALIPSPLLKIISQVSYMYEKYIFLQVHKVLQPYSLSFTFAIHPLPPSQTLHITRHVLYSCPSLFKHMFIFQRGFAMVFHLRVSCTSVSLNPSTTLPYPFSLPSIIQYLSVPLVMSFSYTDAMYFNVIHSLS
jgi:hypothetical protein